MTFGGWSFIDFSMEVAYKDNIGAYTIQLNVQEEVIFYRDEKPYRKRVNLWDGGGNFGYAGKDVIKDTLLRSIEKYAERVANLYLSANPR